MSAQSVRAWIAEHAPDLEFIEVEESTATVATAALALGVGPGQIAKSLAVRAGDHVFLLVTRGDARLDDAKSKAEFGARPRMLGADETLALTGHPVGGVCPFGLASPLRSISTFPCSRSRRSIRPVDHLIRRSGPRRSGCSSWSASAGSTCAGCPTATAVNSNGVTEFLTFSRA